MPKYEIKKDGAVVFSTVAVSQEAALRQYMLVEHGVAKIPGAYNAVGVIGHAEREHKLVITIQEVAA